MTQQRLTLALQSLRDVQGVLGSFVWRRDGQMVASDAPASCAPSTLSAVAVRIQRLCEAFASLEEPVRTATLVYREQRVHVCSLEWAALAVIGSNQLNMSALQLALGLALRELTQLADVVHAAAPAGPLRPRVSAPPAVVDESRASGVHQRVAEPARSYRGQRIGK
jgi:predicted regulator of Ras-like GTPase activity (Roadblock/LC7/MglB family)